MPHVIETQTIRLRLADLGRGLLVFLVLRFVVMPLMGDPRSKDGAP